MKKIILLVLSVLIFVSPVFAFEKKYNEPSTPMEKLVLIEFAILPPLHTGRLSYDLNADLTFKFYKENSVKYNEIVGAKIVNGTSLNLIYGNSLYGSPEYLNLKNQGIRVYELISDRIYLPEGSFNFIDLDKYGRTESLTKYQYVDEKENLAGICNSLNTDGAMICYFYMDGYDVMYLEANFFDATGTYIKRVSVTKKNMFLSKKNFEDTFLKAVDKLVEAMNKKDTR